MNFEYPELEGLALVQSHDVARALEKLCGEEIKLSSQQVRDLERAINSIRSLGYEQLNEILLIAGQDRVMKPFYDFFFASFPDETPRARLRAGIIRFCGFAMLCYGNFRFAYKELSQLCSDDFWKVVSEYDSEEGSKRFVAIKDSRGSKTIDITPILRDQTWFIGYISASLLDKDLRTFYTILYKLQLMNEREIQEKFRQHFKAMFTDPARVDKEAKNAAERVLNRADTVNAQIWKSQLTEIEEQLEKLKQQLKVARDTAKSNTDIYLIWEHIDVYFATSMRHRWEFEGVYDFIREAFAQPALDGVPLCYFDPTQSFSYNRIDKGLVEGLMLNRAFLTVYLAQETDTLGKDSELASTLAQGKPVIAYVPQTDEKYWETLPSQPLDFFLKRAWVLLADEAFKDEKCFKELTSRYGPSVLDRLGNHIDLLSTHIENRTFYLVGKEDDQFKEKYQKEFCELSSMVGICEHHYFDRRAYALGKVHPLGVQVNLRNGVANGVLVVRDVSSCASLINEILSNNMKFSIVNEEGMIELREMRSGCPYRVVTEDSTLANSFWNFYLTERARKVYKE